MKTILFIVLLAFSACCNTKDTKQSTGEVESAVNSGTSKNEGKVGDVSQVQKLPACINDMIARFKKEGVANPPRKIFSYTYHGKTVYYVQPECCDNFSDVYDADCKLLGHPDGGFTGRGDGQMTDFSTATNKKLVWEDTRKH